MNTSNTQQSPATPTAPSEGVSGGGLIKSYEQRAADVFGDSSNEAGGDAGGQTSPGDPNATPSAPTDEVAARRAQRQKDLKAAQAEMRQSVDSRQRFRQAEEGARRAQALERERDAIAQQLASRIDPASLDEAGFFALAERLHIEPKKLGQWLTQRQTHPEVIASQYAQREIDPKIQALEAKLAERDARLEQLEQHNLTTQQTQEAYGRGEAMINFTQGAAAQAPHSARFLEVHGADEFLKIANEAFGGVPKGHGWEQHVLDQIEEQLTSLAKIFAPPAPTGQQHQQRQAPPIPHRGAAQPMTTVSNTLAQGRASVVADEEADWAALPYEERAARLFR